jgi:hypothetical protein
MNKKFSAHYIPNNAGAISNNVIEFHDFFFSPKQISKKLQFTLNLFSGATHIN